MIDSDSSIPIITLNVNDLEKIVKIQTFELNKKARPKYSLSIRNLFHLYKKEKGGDRYTKQAYTNESWSNYIHVRPSKLQKIILGIENDTI